MKESRSSLRSTPQKVQATTEDQDHSRLVGKLLFERTRFAVYCNKKTIYLSCKCHSSQPKHHDFPWNRYLPKQTRPLSNMANYSKQIGGGKNRKCFYNYLKHSGLQAYCLFYSSHPCVAFVFLLFLTFLDFYLVVIFQF